MLSTILYFCHCCTVIVGPEKTQLHLEANSHFTHTGKLIPIKCVCEWICTSVHILLSLCGHNKIFLEKLNHVQGSLLAFLFCHCGVVFLAFFSDHPFRSRVYTVVFMRAFIFSLFPYLLQTHPLLGTSFLWKSFSSCIITCVFVCLCRPSLSAFDYEHEEFPALTTLMAGAARRKLPTRQSKSVSGRQLGRVFCPAGRVF